MYNCGNLIFRGLLILLSIAMLHTIGAQSWKPLKGALPKQLTGLYASKSSNYMLVTSLHSGIYRSVDEGVSWTTVLPTKDSLYTLQAINDQILLAGSSGGIYRSTDSGKTWQRHSIGNRAKLGHIKGLPSGKILAGAGTMWDRSIKPSGILLSSDTGKSWSAHNVGIGNDNPLVEALAVTPNGTILIGIHDENVGLQGKYGIFVSSDEALTWQRVSVNVDLPFNVHYEDAKLRIGSVFNIAVANNQVIAAIEGVYSNFGFAFSIKKPLAEINNTSNWEVHWVEDSLAAQGSYYEQTINLYADSRGTQWASISSGNSETNNTIYRGMLSAEQSWTKTNDGLSRGFGRYLFAENGDGHLFTTSYYRGDSIFVFDLNDVHTAVSHDQLFDAETVVFPNPYVNTGLYLKDHGRESDFADVQIIDLSGNIVFSKSLLQSKDSLHELLPVGYLLGQGFYFLHIRQGSRSLYHKFIAQ